MTLSDSSLEISVEECSSLDGNRLTFSHDDWLSLEDEEEEPVSLRVRFLG